MPEVGPGSQRRRRIFFGLTAIGLVATLGLFREVLLPFLLAIVIAYVLDPLVGRLQHRMPRWIAVVIMIFALLGVIGGVTAVAVPPIVVEVERFTTEAPALLRRARSEWLPAVERGLRERMEDYAEEGEEAVLDVLHEDEAASTSAMDAGVPDHASSGAILIEPRESGGYAVYLPPQGVEVRRDGNRHIVGGGSAPKTTDGDVTSNLTGTLAGQLSGSEVTAMGFLRTVNSVVQGVARGIFGFFLTLMLAAYLMISKEGIFSFFRAMVLEGRQRGFDDLIRRIDKGLSGVVRGQMMIAVVNAILTGIGYYFLDLPYWPILTLFALVFSIIPIFGVIISSIPALIIGVAESPMTALLVLGWILIIHQIEANLLNPKIMGDAAKVHPVLVIFALLGGEHLFGLIGALLAVPVLSIAQSLFLHYREIALGVPVPTSSAGSVEAGD
ncbi:MAG: AI-2E family transporter [Deltaproteobacteria bacterium]|nr:MAG: AI-2E family transporter [Deltaproteobacteria bacterium]